MATIAESINSSLCAYSSITGTEVSKGCINQIKKMRASWYIKPGEEFRAGEEFKSEFDRLIKKQALIVLNGVDTVEENGSDDNVFTSDSFVEQVTQEGLYKWALTFRNGLFFNSAMKQTLDGFKKWNHIFITADGVYGTKTPTGGVTGFTTGQIKQQKLTLGTSTDSQAEMQTIQYLDRDELDIDFAFIANREARKWKGVTQINLSFVNSPSDGDTTLTVKATLAQDGSEVFTGVDYEAFSLSNNGTTANPTEGDDSAVAGTYPLTVTSLSTNDALNLRLYNSADNSPVIVGPDGDYYKSNVLTATVV